MNTNYDVIVIGAALGGVAAALRLNKMGYKVLVLEKNETYGGKLSQFTWQGYRWDKGPSLFTLPHQVDELFELYGKNPREYFNYHTMDESCHYYFQDGTDFIFPSGVKEREKELVNTFGEEGEKAINYIDESRTTYEAIGDLFIDHPKYKLKNIFDKELVKRYPMFMTRKLMGSLDRFNRSKFKDDRLVNLFNRYATYNGSDPYKMSGLYSMIPHLEMNDGTYFPTKGMRSIVGSLYDLAVAEGVTFQFNQTAIQLNKVSKGIYNVTSGGDSFKVNRVVSAIDCVNFYKKIANDKALGDKYGNKERSASANVFYWAVDKAIPELKLHNIFFGENYKEEFRKMFDEKDVFEAPTVYIHVSSTVNPQDAPENGQNWFVMINVTAGLDINEEIKEKYRQYIYALIKKHFDVDIKPHVVHEESWEPARIGEYTGAHLGALYGASSNSKLAAITRHGNDSKKYENVYFCGGTVHPGGGIPLVLKSAKIVAELMEKNK